MSQCARNDTNRHAQKERNRKLAVERMKKVRETKTPEEEEGDRKVELERKRISRKRE